MPEAFSCWVAIEAVTLAFLFANWFWKPRVRNPSIRAGLFWVRRMASIRRWRTGLDLLEIRRGAEDLSSGRVRLGKRRRGLSVLGADPERFGRSGKEWKRRLEACAREMSWR